MSIRDQIRQDAEARRAAEAAEIAARPKPTLSIPPVEALSDAEKAAAYALTTSQFTTKGFNFIAMMTDDRTMDADKVQTAIDLFGGESVRVAISGDDPSLANEDVIGLFTDLGDKVVVVELGEDAPTSFARFMQVAADGYLGSIKVDCPDARTVIFVTDSQPQYRALPLNRTTYVN